MNINDPVQQLSALTEREREVLRLVCDGLPYKSIGEELFIAEATVKSHMGNIYVKLGLDSLLKSQRKLILYQVYCPVLQETTFTPKPDEPDGPEPEAVPKEIIVMVEEDDVAIMPYPQKPLQPIDVVESPPPYYAPPRRRFGGFMLGLIIGIGVFAVILYALWQAGIIGGGGSLPEISDAPPVEVVVDTPLEPEPEKPTQTQTNEEVVIVATPTSPPPTQTLPPSTQTSPPTEIPTSTPVPNTQAGTVLELGQSWRQDGMLLRLSEIYLKTSGTGCSIGLGWDIENRTSSTVIVSAYSSQFELVDNRDERWKISGVQLISRCPKFEDTISDDIEPGGKFPSRGFHTLWVGFDGPLTDIAVDYLIVTVTGLSNFNGAQWKIPINN